MQTSCVSKKYDISEQYHREGLSLILSDKDSALMARYYINMGLMFADMGKIDSATHYYENGIFIADKVDGLKNRTYRGFEPQSSCI